MGRSTTVTVVASPLIALDWKFRGKSSGSKWQYLYWLVVWWLGKPWENHGKMVIYIVIVAGWWFGTSCIFGYIGNVIIPTDYFTILHIFQRDRYTTNQICFLLVIYHDISN